jgi:diacylglycerol kinase (ATP)
MSGTEPAAWRDERVLAVLSAANLQRLPLIKQDLAEAGIDASVVAPDDLEHLSGVLRRSHGVQHTILALGGDGWVHRVLQHLDLSNQCLGVLPAGTGNDLAHALGLPSDLRRSIRQLSQAQPQRIDLGEINGIRYVNSAGFGLDSATLRTRHNNRGLLHQNYLAAFVYSLSRLKTLVGSVSIDGQTFSSRYMWVLAMNSPYIGGGINIAPGARLDDGKLNVLLIHETSKWVLLANMPAAVKGRHLGIKAAQYSVAERIECEMVEPVDTLAVDGEEHFCGERQVSIQVVPGALRVLR